MRGPISIMTIIPLKVVIFQRRLTHYRIAFFEALRLELSQRDIALSLVVGQGTAAEILKSDSGDIDWKQLIPTKYFFNDRLCWQQKGPFVAGADLVIITQENALLGNLPLIFGRRRFKLAFWGHGANFQSKQINTYREKFKKLTNSKVDWWFAYTSLSKEMVASTGFQPKKITVVDNTIDTTTLESDVTNINPKEIASLRKKFGLSDEPVGIFVGSLYTEKKIAFLLAAANEIRDKVPNFTLFILGDGPDRHLVETWCEIHNWTHYVGTAFARDKALYLSIADIVVNPGLVGLGILDSFVAGVPLLTTDCGVHSPEVAYLESGFNGVMTRFSQSEYVEACISLLGDQYYLNELRRGCLESSRKYTLENMVNKFADGIESALCKNNA